MTKQPEWQFVANIGDVNPVDHGGRFIFKDKTGVYQPEVEILVPPEMEDGKDYVIYRYILESCTFLNGVLSDNKFHKNHEAWFARDIVATARFAGMTEATIIGLLCSENCIDRAIAYEAIESYHGVQNFDQYPRTLTKEEAEDLWRKRRATE